MFLDGMLTLWFILTGLSLIYITYDLIAVTPEAPVMKAGWWLVTLYTGPIGLFFYLLSCKEPMPGTHEKFIEALWKQSLGSMVHCLAGDVTGIIIAAIVLTFIPIPISWEIFIEYLAGFAFGLLIFQSLFMKGMMGGTYGKALKMSFYPEFVSMNMIMAGMIPVMVIWNTYDPEAKNTFTLNFWGKMSLATLIAGITAFPINRWLVKKGLKHGMMTVRDESEERMHHEHHGHDMHGHQSHEMYSHEEHKHQEPTATRGEMQACLWLSLLGLAVGIAIAILGYHYKI